MKLAIIAGGKGTRLGFDNIPKSMVRVGNKPILEVQIELAVSYGISEIYILSGYLSDQIVNYFGDGTQWNIKLHHIIESQPLGTAGAIRQLEYIMDEPFLVFYGDTIFDVNLERFINFSRREKNIATIFVHPNDHPHDSDLLEFNEDNHISQFYPKPHDQEKYYFNLVNAALYILTPDIFKYIPEDRPTDFGKDIFPALIRNKEMILAYKSPEYIKDMGTKQRLEKTITDYLSGKIASLNLRNKRTAIFLDRDGVINKEVGNLAEIKDFELLPQVGEAIKKINKSTSLAIVITNQPIIAKGMSSLANLDEIHKKLDTLLGEQNAYLDHLYYCPHHPDRGFINENAGYKVDCDCRKPKIGLINKAVKEFNIDLMGSFFIGDSTTDIQTAKNASITSILLRTGHEGKDGKYDVKPDFLFNDLDESVDFCINRFPMLLSQIGSMLQEQYNYLSLAKNAVISVAGLSRSGKSTFAKCLEILLLQKGFKTKIINLDNWILSIEERNESMTVRDRFNYQQISKDLGCLLENKEIVINEYDVNKRGINGRKHNLSIEHGEILILDGIVALDIESIRNLSAIKFFIDIDETIRKERFLTFYQKKGLTISEAETLYNKRILDEHKFIEPTKAFAQTIVNLESL